MKINKITIGFVIQTWDTTENKWISQEFIAGDEVDYENEQGETIKPSDVFPDNEPYLPYEMVQPVD